MQFHFLKEVHFIMGMKLLFLFKAWLDLQNLKKILESFLLGKVLPNAHKWFKSSQSKLKHSKQRQNKVLLVVCTVTHYIASLLHKSWHSLKVCNGRIWMSAFHFPFLKFIMHWDVQQSFSIKQKKIKSSGGSGTQKLGAAVAGNSI